MVARSRPENRGGGEARGLCGDARHHGSSSGSRPSDNGGMKQIYRQYKAYRLAQSAKGETAIPYLKFLQRFTASMVRDVAISGRMI